jgi:hypothetical protein
MNADIKTLLEFLANYGADTSGRSMEQPESHIASLLERFARGECSPAERDDVCRMLKLHPAWLRWLADRVKLSRKVTHETQADTVAV